MEWVRTNHLRGITTGSSNAWGAWVVLFLGGLLTVSAIWLALTNLDRTVILYVLIPGTGIGTILMLLGALGLRVCEELEGLDAAHRQSVEGKLVIYLVVSISFAMSAGIASGVLFGSVVLGITVGPLVGLAVGMAAWIFAQRSDA